MRSQVTEKFFVKEMVPSCNCCCIAPGKCCVGCDGICMLQRIEPVLAEISAYIDVIFIGDLNVCLRIKVVKIIPCVNAIHLRFNNRFGEEVYIGSPATYHEGRRSSFFK